MKFSYLVVMFSIVSGVSNVVIAAPYMGAGIGSASYEADLTALGGGGFDDSGTGTKIYGGYAFNKYLAAEVAYYNFAEASVSASGFGPTSSIAVEMTGLGAYGVGLYPVSKKFNLIAKLGLLNWDADLRVNNTSATNDGTDLAYGLGASYAFTKQLLAVAEWETFESDNPEVSLFSIGFKFIFK